ncbi:UNVERIFIED_CONTAM: hypothetical protein PYX00_003302 [Menopon gallinae]|uniref:Uncharacterized protein n=1 Tax=Menopon gallinae TaxID=328185 RepID=A0AAW2HZC6_9NEOP
MGESIASTGRIAADEKVVRNGGERIPRAAEDVGNLLGRLSLGNGKPETAPKSSSLTNALSISVPEPESVPFPPKRPTSLSGGFGPYTPPAPPPATTTPMRRPVSAYASSGISCMVPASASSSTLPRRPTTLYAEKTAAAAAAETNPFRARLTPQRKIAYQTWSSSSQPQRRAAANSSTWSSRRPYSVAGAPVSPSDSGYRSLPSSASDYQVSQQTDPAPSARRRLSLPSAQAQLRPKPSPTFHGLPFRPFTCGVSPSGSPIFLGCTHLHPSPGSNKPRAVTPTASQAIHQFVMHPRNGYRSPDDKIALFYEILDSQERFAKSGLSG